MSLRNETRRLIPPTALTKLRPHPLFYQKGNKCIPHFVTNLIPFRLFIGKLINVSPIVSQKWCHIPYFTRKLINVAPILSQNWWKYSPLFYKIDGHILHLITKSMIKELSPHFIRIRDETREFYTHKLLSKVQKSFCPRHRTFVPWANHACTHFSWGVGDVERIIIVFNLTLPPLFWDTTVKYLTSPPSENMIAWHYFTVGFYSCRIESCCGFSSLFFFFPVCAYLQK